MIEKSILIWSLLFQKSKLCYRLIDIVKQASMSDLTPERAESNWNW